MLVSRVSVTAMVGAGLFALGCGAAPLDGAEEAVGVAEEPILWANGDSPSFFWNSDTQRELRQLATQPLIDTNGLLAPTALLATAEGRELLHYVVGCAVAPGRVVATSMVGVSFEGAVGVAEDWAKDALSDTRGQRWMTACLLQTLNGIGQHVPIMMLGGQQAFTNDPAVDVSAFTYPDATMFGNIFPVPVDRLTRNAFACIDKAIVERCDNSTSSYAQKRICDSSPTCGLELLLPSCADWCSFEKDGSARCLTPTGDIYTETITTFLTEDGFNNSYRTCRGSGGG